MKRSIIIGIIFLQVIYSCNYSSEKKIVKTQEIKKLEWLIGTWENTHGEREFYEIWKILNDSTYYGESFLLINKDTAFSESMLIKQTENNLFFIPTIKDQNGGNSVTFKLISSENEKFVFENKEHDFPQRIIYTNPSLDSLHAYIEGEENGKYQKTDFRFKRN